MLGSVFGDELPPAPSGQVYDPDFLLSKVATADLSKSLTNFAATQELTVYLAVFTKTPRLSDETAKDLNQAWDQSGLGAVITFSPRRREAKVLPSPQLSLTTRASDLTATFLKGAQSGLDRGNDSLAAQEGTAALLRQLREIRAETAAVPVKKWRLGRLWLLTGFGVAGLVGLAFLWSAARVWRRSNLFDHSYRFPVATTPAPLRFGAQRCGGLMATLNLRGPTEKRS